MERELTGPVDRITRSGHPLPLIRLRIALDARSQSVVGFS
jgi:hypothetical protein